MASDAVQFFRKAFLASLLNPELPPDLLMEFQKANKLLCDDDRMRRIRSSPQSSATLLHKLYDLKDALAEYGVFLLQQRQRQRQRRKQITTNLFRHDLSQIFVSKWQKNTYLSRMKKRLESMNEDLDKFFEESDTDLPTPTAIITPFNRHSSLEADTSQYIGFGENQVKLQELLLSSDKYKAIGVYGMSGSGKTAIVQKVLSLPNVGQYFHPIIWVCLSDTRLHEDADFASRITKHILYKMGCDVDEWPIINPTTTQLLEHLEKSLMSKRYLIVLDDVWEVSDFLCNLGHTGKSPTGVRDDRLWHGLPKDSGGAVIITSRLKQVAEKMVGLGESESESKGKGNRVIHMKPLEREMCKILLLLKTELAFKPYEGQILDWLNLKGFKVIGIYGPNSWANTRLINKVLESSSVGENFSPIIRVCVSEKDTPDKILSCLLRELRYDEVVEPMKDHAQLFTTLKNLLASKKYLIVLDDVRHLDYWYSCLNSSLAEDYPSRLSQALPTNSNGAVIVATTGTRRMAQYLVSGSYSPRLIHLNLEEDAIQQDIAPSVIVDLCAGLPLAATTIVDVIQEKGIPISLAGPSRG